MSWIYLSKHGQDEYINLLAQGAGVPPTPLENWNYHESPHHGLFIRGIMKHKLIKQCWKDQRPFFFVDTGYFGNRISRRNPHGWKIYHRIVFNDLQHDSIIDRPDDRLRGLDLEIRPWRKPGRNILIAAPDEKPCIFYGTTQEVWLDHTVQEIKKHTDRPILIRHRDPNIRRRTRDPQSSFAAALEQDVFAVVTFNSAAATESVLHGIPAFVTAPNAARPVCETDLSRIETPKYPDIDLVRKWAAHLAYGQFHIDEMRSGTAQRILEQTLEIMTTKCNTPL